MKFKKVLAGITTFAIALTAAATPLCELAPLPTVAQEASAAISGDFEYTVLYDGTVEISKYNGSASKVIIPSEINGKPVTSIGQYAFYRCSSLTSITIPNSVTSIGYFVFYKCERLTSITIPDSVKVIEDDAFWYCSSLTSITIPNSVTSIGNFAFCDCSSLKSVTIGNSVKSIGREAFKNCSNLTSINIPDGVKNIGEQAFWFCSSLTSINIPDSVTNIGNAAFSYCSSLTSINIPNNITSIGYGAFESCKSLTCINIPDSVTSIDDYAFNFCSSLKSITIPSNIKSVGESAFDLCDSLKNVYYSGTEAQWKKIKIGEYNDELLNATIHYNSSALFAPTGLKLKGRANNALRISWNKNTSADGYIVEMYKGGKWTRVAKITKNTTVEYRQAGLAAGTAYKFRVKAYKMNGSTATYSSYVSISARTNPSNVTGLKTLGRAKTAVRFGWTKNTSADGYIVEMYKGGKWVRAAKITKNSTVQFKKTGLKANTTYKFRIKAYKMSGKTALYSGYTNYNIATTK